MPWPTGAAGGPTAGGIFAIADGLTLILFNHKMNVDVVRSLRLNWMMFEAELDDVGVVDLKEGRESRGEVEGR